MTSIALALALFLGAESNPVNVWTGAAPSGSCKGNRVVVTTTGLVYSCVTGTWAQKMEQAVATPTFSPVTGNYNGTQSVTISDDTGGATIYYTTDGSTPTTASSTYSSPVSVTATKTVKALAALAGYATSSVGSAVYAITPSGAVAPPSFDPPGGSYGVYQTITLTAVPARAQMFYTVDGSTPTTSSTRYTGPFVVPASLTVKAIAVADGLTNSTVSSAAYVISAANYYYVDGVHGSDQSGTNPCTSYSAPCATIARLRAVGTVSGSAIFLARNSVFHETIDNTTAPDGGAIVAYGSGIAPKFDASDPVVGTWTKTGGYTYIYQISWSFQATEFDSSNSAHRVWENGTRLIRATSVANCDATAGSFYAPTPTGGADTIYVHASDGSNPNSNGKLYEAADRMWGIDAGRYVGGEHIVALVDGVWTRRNGGGSGSLLTAGVVRNSIAEDGYKHNFWVGGEAYDCIAWKNEPTPYVGGFTAFVSFFGNSQPGASYTRCVAVTDNGTNATGFYAHTPSTSYLIASMSYTDSYAIGYDTGFGGSYAEATNATYTRVGTYNCQAGIDIGLATNSVTITDSNFVRGVGGNFTAIMGGNAAPVTTTINRIRMIDGGSGGYPVRINYGTTVNLSNSVLVANDQPILWFYATTAMTVNFNHNILYIPATDATDFDFTAGGGGITYRGDYNILTFTLAWPNFRASILGTNYTSLATWRTASGQDAHSLDTSPLFAGNPTTGDTSLQSGSPALTLPAGPDVAGAPIMPNMVQWTTWDPTMPLP